MELEASRRGKDAEKEVEMDLRESSEAQVHRKTEAHRLEQEIQMRERLAESRRVYEEKFQKLLDEESLSLESEMRRMSRLASRSWKRPRRGTRFPS